MNFEPIISMKIKNKDVLYQVKSDAGRTKAVNVKLI